MVGADPVYGTMYNHNWKAKYQCSGIFAPEIRDCSVADGRMGGYRHIFPVVCASAENPDFILYGATAKSIIRIVQLEIAKR